MLIRVYDDENNRITYPKYENQHFSVNIFKGIYQKKY